MAINDRTQNGTDPTRGSGDEKITEAVEPGLDGPPDGPGNEARDSNAADPARGGCFKFGWGCLPAMLLIVLMPAGLLF